MQNRSSIPLSIIMSLGVLASSSQAFALDCSSEYKIQNRNGLSKNQVKHNLISEAAKKDKKTEPKKESKKDSKKDDKEKVVKEPVLTNVVEVTALKLVDSPKTYLGKNIKFKSDFFAFSNLALNYKPALRENKKYISFLVYRPKSKIPFSELKLAMKIPKEKDPKNKMLTSLQDGDTIEITGNVFSTALDEPWVDVLKLKKLASKKKSKNGKKDTKKK